MEHFVTIFDRLFIPQGLALIRSMERHVSDFTLWVICMDEKTRDVLDAYNVSNLKLLEIEKLETDELVKIKRERGLEVSIAGPLLPLPPNLFFLQILKFSE